jgi:histidine triad (HIT) family protein
MSRHCIFCSIISGDLPCIEVFQDKDFIAIMDKYPISRGHTLVLPKKHYVTLLQMPSTEVGRLYSLASVIAKAVVSATGADGFNMGQNNGTSANQIVPHVHVHLVPRFKGDSPDGRWPARTVASNEVLDSIAQKIKGLLEITEQNSNFG